MEIGSLWLTRLVLNKRRGQRREVAVGRLFGIVFAVLAFLYLVGSCVGDNDDAADYAPVTTDDITLSATLPPTMEGEVVAVPSDPGATYRLLAWSRMPNGDRQALTRRDGPSGTSFARREVDCNAMTFRYLGEGDTREAAERDGPNPGEMGPLTEQSISTYVSEFVCSR